MSHVIRKPVLPNANNTGADQPANPRSLISAFVIRCLDSIISLVSISKISSLSLVSEAVRFESYMVGNLEDRCSCDEAQIIQRSRRHFSS